MADQALFVKALEESIMNLETHKGSNPKLADTLFNLKWVLENTASWRGIDDGEMKRYSLSRPEGIS